MKTRLSRGRVAGLLLLSATLLAQAPDDAVLRALRDEVARSRNLKVENLEPPYFIEGTADDIDSFSATAMLGGLVRSSRSRLRVPRVQVRVGDYKFDNTNYAGFFGGRSQFDRLPLDDAYPVLRRYLWLGTDRAYKSALETISRKRAALRNVSAGELPDDFAKATPLKRIEPVSFVPVDESAWTRRVRALSAVFSRYPAIRSSLTEMEAVQNVHYLVNSEGTEVRFGERILFVRSRGSSQAADGMILRDTVSFHAKDFSRFPSDADLTAATTTMAENLTALAAAPKGEPYSGPVVFEREAAAQLLAAVLGKSLSLSRRPITDPGRSGGFPASELEGRTGSRILPEFLDVVDDPTQTEWRGRPLLGSYSVDLEGVLAQPLTLIEKGVLKNFLLTRQPMRNVSGSNGRARMPGSFGANTASFSNLFIQSRDPVSLADLKKRLIEMVRARSKPYGILLRRLDFPSSASFEELRRIMSASSSGSATPAPPPILAYRVYPDGREELVRGLRFKSFTIRTLKDILAASDDLYLFEYLDNPAPLALLGAAGFIAETSVIAPSILIDDIELDRIDDELPKIPLVPPPS